MLAVFLKRGRLIETKEFWHSSLVRARTTAERLAADLGGKIKLSAVSGIEPYADPEPLAARLRSLRRPVAVIGHEPHLSAVATLLLDGKPAASLVVLKKGAVLALERSGRRWAVRWLVSPGELRSGR